MILVDTGPLVALFDPADRDHRACRDALKREGRRWVTTVPVLTEAFHLLGPETPGARALRTFVVERGLEPWFVDADALDRVLELMERYTDLPMDLADASLVAAAERLGTRRVLTLDARDFSAYRVLRGRRHLPFLIERC